MLNRGKRCVMYKAQVVLGFVRLLWKHNANYQGDDLFALYRLYQLLMLHYINMQRRL